MTEVVAEETLEDAILEMNTWHPRTPLFLVFSKQHPGPEGEVSGSINAVADLYNDIFGMHKIGITDESQRFHLKLCHGASGAREYPHGQKWKTERYGKGYQRTIKDTLTDYGLERIDSGQYLLEPGFPDRALEYLRGSMELEDKLDLRPLVIWYYWDDIENGTTVGELWSDFCDTFGTDERPFDEMFFCSNQDQVVPTQDPESDPYSIKALVLPSEYGGEQLDSEFWMQFRNALVSELEELDWEAPSIERLATAIASGLMSDQAIFLLGPPGTGKSTIVNDAIIDALREAYSGEGGVLYEDFVVSPETTQADLLGFQGLDGNWVMGPAGDAILYEIDGGSSDKTAPESSEESRNDDEKEDDDGAVSIERESVPHVMFFDEANRVNVEDVLSPLQSAFDRMRQGKEPGLVPLGQDEYLMPRRVLRIFAGNSPAEDIGLKEQSRAFKRRVSVIPMPDYLPNIIGDGRRFPALIKRRLRSLSEEDDVAISQPTTELLGAWESNEEDIESLNEVLEAVQELPNVPVTIGLLESILLRTATHYQMDRSNPVDAALTQTLIGMMSGDADQIEDVAEVAGQRQLSEFHDAIQTEILEVYEGRMVHDLNPIL